MAIMFVVFVMEIGTFNWCCVNGHKSRLGFLLVCAVHDVPFPALEHFGVGREIGGSNESAILRVFCYHDCSLALILRQIKWTTWLIIRFRVSHAYTNTVSFHTFDSFASPPEAGVCFVQNSQIWPESGGLIKA